MPLEWDPARGPGGELLLLGAEQPQAQQQQQEESFCPEMVIHREEETEMVLEGVSHGIGTLYVTSRRLAWLRDAEQPSSSSCSSSSSGKSSSSSPHSTNGSSSLRCDGSSSSCGGGHEDQGSSSSLCSSSSAGGIVTEGRPAADSRSIAIDYPSIVLHAVSRDGAGGHRACIYCQLKSTVAEEDEDATVPELRFIPSHLSSNTSSDKEDALDKIFRAMTEMAALNPDNDAASADDDEDDFFVNSGDSLPNGWEFVEDSKDGIAAEAADEAEPQQQQDAVMEEEKEETH